MRVLHLATTYPLHRGDSNAAFVQAICEGLACLGHEIEVLVPWHPDLQLERPDSAVKLHAFRYTPTRRWHPWGYAQALSGDRRLRPDAYLAAVPAAWTAWRAIRRLQARHPYDLLHAHWLVPNAPIVAAARRADGPPLIVSCHGSGVFLAERFAWVRRLAEFALARSAAVTACSADLTRRVAAFAGCPPPRRLPYGVDTQRFVPLDAATRSAVRQQLGERHDVPAEAPWILAVGRLVYKKGFDVLIEAMPRVLAEHPEARALIVGSGPLENELRAQADGVGVTERAAFVGAVPHRELPIYYAAADAVAVPSVHGPAGNVDGLPNTLMEALSSATPVVASAVAGIPDVVVDGDNGLLVAERDAAALAAGLLRLLDDPQLRREIGERARGNAEAELDWTRIAASFDDVYRAVGV